LLFAGIGGPGEDRKHRLGGQWWFPFEAAKKSLTAYSPVTPAKVEAHASAARADSSWYNIATAWDFQAAEEWVPALRREDGRRICRIFTLIRILAQPLRLFHARLFSNARRIKLPFLHRIPRSVAAAWFGCRGLLATHERLIWTCK
jgi:hypothetical protein